MMRSLWTEHSSRQLDGQWFHDGLRWPWAVVIFAVVLGLMWLYVRLLGLLDLPAKDGGEVVPPEGPPDRGSTDMQDRGGVG